MASLDFLRQNLDDDERYLGEYTSAEIAQINVAIASDGYRPRLGSTLTNKDTGQLHTLAGVNGSASFASVSGDGNSQSGSGGLRTVVAGDSITITSTALGPPIRFGGGFSEMAVYKTGSRALLFNAGVAGNTSQQLRDRFLIDVSAYGPTEVILMIGTNDYGSSLVTSSQIVLLMDNIKWMYQECLRIGAVLRLVVPPPKDISIESAKVLRPYFYDFASKYGVMLCDLYMALLDPTTGGFLAANTSDGTHLSAAGRSISADVLTQRLLNETSRNVVYLAGASELAANGTANLLRNGNFVRQTSGAADGWTPNLTNASVSFTDATYPYSGKTMVYTKTVAGAVYAFNSSGLSINAGLAVGDVIQFTGKLKVSGLPASPVGFNVEIQFNGVGSAHRPLNAMTLGGEFILSTEIVVPVGTTSLGMNLYVNDIGVYELSNWTLVNKTKRQAIWSP